MDANVLFSSLRTSTVIAGVLGRAGQRGKERRIKDAANGEVTWENPMEISVFLNLEKRRKGQEEEAARAASEAEDGGPQDMDGVMTAAQLEAHQLLQELERERRSSGRRKRGGDDN
jgi:hypothetical protein